MEANSSGAWTTSCVVVGRFNPAILHPTWIVKEGVLPSGEAEVGQALGSTIVQFRLGGYMWRSSQAKFEVYSESEGLDPGEFVAKVLEILPHTPVRGVGNNFATSFEGDVSVGLESLVVSPLVAAVAAPSNEILAQSSTLSILHEGEAIAQVTLEMEQKQVEVNLNFHRDCASAAAGAEAARRWKTDKEEAARLLERILAYARHSTHDGS